MPESEGDHALNIGNLILLEQSINNEAGQKCYSDKSPYYDRSNYMWVAKFKSEHLEWTDLMIDARAVEMAKTYYNKIIGKDIP